MKEHWFGWLQWEGQKGRSTMVQSVASHACSCKSKGKAKKYTYIRYGIICVTIEVVSVVTWVISDVMRGSHKVVVSRKRSRQSVFTIGLHSHRIVVTIGHRVVKMS